MTGLPGPAPTVTRGRGHLTLAEVAALTDCQDASSLAGFVLVTVHAGGRFHVASNCMTPAGEGKLLRDAAGLVDPP